MEKRMLKKTIFALLVSTTVFSVIFVSCNKSEINPMQVSPVKWEITNKENQKIINDVISLYEQSVIEAINTRNSTLKSTSDVNGTVNLINTNFDRKCDNYVIKTESRPTVEAMNPDILHYYLHELSDRLLNIDALTDTAANESKDEVLDKFDLVLDNFNNQVMNDPSITATDKQAIIENAVFRFNIARINLKYGEEISGEPNLKSFGSWVRKNQKKVECATKSIMAVAACATATSTSATGATAVVLWTACAVQAINAVTCWANI